MDKKSSGSGIIIEHATSKAMNNDFQSNYCEPLFEKYVTQAHRKVLGISELRGSCKFGKRTAIIEICSSSTNKLWIMFLGEL